MELVNPSLALETEFLQFYADYEHNDKENGEYYRDGKLNFPKYVQSLLDEAKGINLKDGYVPCNHFWLIDKNNSILGIIRVRHNIDTEFLANEAGHIGYDIAPSCRGKGYGKSMLKQALAEARKLGLKKALITADKHNIASRKVIEANHGEFENYVEGKVIPGSIARYWVPC
ncbi:acetyltransferase [Photobacterium jeanii]|uniref:Acetyltransferase n=1 Tax=Photobacterium jeanii TaxID=858640 RepID=A0A178K7K9_9GAMM|nr:GNAT family N-acetyltransferase [Photobacterium jeanii]OAN13310.1 acetyltransferase [Photobacterium jeanii]PST90309.1 GNAT family acetyltransferase [Photobacterium jeanii]